MKDTLIIIGASGHGRVVADIAIKMERWKKISFLDDNADLHEFMGIEVAGSTERYEDYVQECEIFVGIGNNEVRKCFHEHLIAANASIPILIHPTAVIGSEVNIGKGTAVMAGVVINSCTQIGQGCIVNTSCSIDHDCVIEDFVHLSPGVRLAGNVTVGNGSWLGIGSSVSNNINIVKKTVTGAGAVVVKDILSSGTYVGIPVRRVTKE